MSLDKRPRSPNSSHVAETHHILISDDEEPPRKRQKSITPANNGTSKPTTAPALVRPSTPTAGQSTTTPAIKESNSVKKPSPWKNRPSWQKKTSTRTESLDQDALCRTTSISHDRGLNDWTVTDNNLLRELSLTQDDSDALRSWANGKPSPRQSETVQEITGASITDQESEQLVNKFKIGSATSLRFNPNNGSLPSHPAALSAAKSTAKVHQGQSQPQQRSHTRDHSKGLTSVAPVNPLRHSNDTFSQRLAKPKPSDTIGVSVGPKSLAIVPPPSAAPLKTVQNQSLIPPRPHQPPKISINVPLTDVARLKKERSALQERLKHDVKYAEEHTAEVERLLGLTGFSEQFAPALDEEKFRNAAQTKKRIVDRRTVTLDLGQGQPQAKSAQRKDFVFVHPKDQAKDILTARFAEDFDPPLTFSNNVNDRRLNGKFQFISEYIFRRGVKVAGQIGQRGCTCSGQCDDFCRCLQKSFRDEKTKRDWYEIVPQYERLRDGLVVLRDDFIRRYTIGGNTESDQPKQRVEITECGENCKCDASCINRVVQKGRTVPLEIFETQRCGFGVRSAKNLVRGQFIELYLGEVITEAELTQREEAAEAGSTSYIYSLDWFSPQQAYHVDGENFGSAMRFVNHSCDPNAGTFTVLNDRSTKQLHHVAFFAIKDIPAGAEITIDYTPQAAGTRYELNAGDEGMEKCYCGAPKCRRMLWLPGKERKARKKTVGRTMF